MDRPGEKRPSIACKKCKAEHCHQCADATIDLCAVMRSMGKSLWTCNECEGKDADMKAVLESMKSIKTELSSIKEGQAEQQVEREQVLEGLKTVKAVAKKLEKIEGVQEKHEQRLSKNEEAIGKNMRKGEEGEKRIKKLEERLEKFDENATDMRQCNAVAREVREMERREKNIVIFNVPEPTETEEEQKTCFEQVDKILKELGFENMKPTSAGRIGKTGRYPRKILAALPSREQCEKIVKKNRDGPTLTNNVFINYDRTFNQRQEARLFRMEREEEEKETPQSERGRGKTRGRPRGRGNFGRGGSGGGGARGKGGGGGRGKGRDDDSRKRRKSEDDENSALEAEDEAKRRRTETRGGTAAVTLLNPQTPANLKNAKSAADREAELGAAGGIAAEENF